MIYSYALAEYAKPAAYLPGIFSDILMVFPPGEPR